MAPLYDYQCQNCMHIVEISKKMTEEADLTDVKCCGSESYRQVILAAPPVHGAYPKDSQYYEKRKK